MIVDTLWVFLAAILVFFMNLGFASLEAGMARSKNTVNILSKNFIVFAVSSLGFMLLGWGFMFGGDNPFIGTEHLFILGEKDLSFYDETLTSNVPFWGKFFFQLVFCGTAATIVSGAVAERIKYLSFIIFSFVLTLVVYPIVGHWVWGGGWLADLGFMDFAGDTVVHSLGGWSALRAPSSLGPALGSMTNRASPGAIPGHNMSLAVIGLFVLWLGWFGFNPGSTMSFQNPSDVMHILMTTNTSAIAAVVTATATSWIFLGKPDLGMTINGCLAGLVAITGGCSYISIVDSLIIGAIAGVIVVFAVVFFDRAKIDDPVGATSVHLCCGVFGTLCIGLFAQEGVTTLSTRNGLFYGGGASLLGIQLAGILAVGAFTFVSALAVWWILKKTIGIRVSREEELAGLDIGEHGNHAYPDFVQAVENIGYSPDGPAVEPLGEVPVSEAVPVKDTTSPGDQKAPQDHQGGNHLQGAPAGGAQVGHVRAGDHRHDRVPCPRLRHPEGQAGVLPGRPGGGEPAAQDPGGHRGQQGACAGGDRNRQESAVHRPYWRRQNLRLRRRERGEGAHRRRGVRSPSGRGVRNASTPP